MYTNEMQVEILEDVLVYGGFFRLRRFRLRHTLFGGGWSSVLYRELFERGSCVAVLPYDPVRDRVVLIEQFRIGAIDRQPPWLVEIVAGAIEPGESADEVAQREALEEAGCEILHLRPIHRFYTSPGGASERLSLYLGIVDSEGLGGVHGLAEEGEDIRVEVLAYDEAMRWLDCGRIDSAIPIIALQWLALHREQVRVDFPDLAAARRPLSCP